MGCGFLQGWLFGRAVPVEELGPLLAAFDPSVLRDLGTEMDTAVHIVGRVG
jgi:EAL domain-containing protein (putative c-di-GMP-specific phosphodiesterase class I)